MYQWNRNLSSFKTLQHSTAVHRDERTKSHLALIQHGSGQSCVETHPCKTMHAARSMILAAVPNATPACNLTRSALDCSFDLRGCGTCPIDTLPLSKVHGHSRQELLWVGKYRSCYSQSCSPELTEVIYMQTLHLSQLHA